MRTNHTKAKLESGETVFGAFVRFPDAALADFLGYLRGNVMLACG